MRTIHEVGEMMTQMVLSRGSIFPVNIPDVPPSALPCKQGNAVEQEDVTVMDTKLKIIEILQVCCLLGLGTNVGLGSCVTYFLCHNLCSSSSVEVLQVLPSL